MSDESTMSLQENIAIVDAMREEAMGVTEDEVQEPDMPITVFMDELNTTAVAAREHLDALSKVGVTWEMAARLERYFRGLRSAQTVWIAEKSRGRGDDHILQIEAAEDLREELMAAGALALRNDLDGQRRLSDIREGDGLADLIDDLRNLAVLLTDKHDLFDAIGMDVDTMAGKADTQSRALQNMLTDEDVAKSLSNSKEMRDRIYTLAKDALKEIRLFAAYAFRKDKSNNRRQIFTSAYMRRKNRRRTRIAAPADTAQ